MFPAFSHQLSPSAKEILCHDFRLYSGAMLWWPFKFWTFVHGWFFQSISALAALNIRTVGVEFERETTVTLFPGFKSVQIKCKKKETERRTPPSTGVNHLFLAGSPTCTQPSYTGTWRYAIIYSSILSASSSKTLLTSKSSEMTDRMQEHVDRSIDLNDATNQLLLICENDELEETGSYFNEQLYWDGCWHPSVHSSAQLQRSWLLSCVAVTPGSETQHSWEICETNTQSEN